MREEGRTPGRALRCRDAPGRQRFKRGVTRPRGAGMGGNLDPLAREVSPAWVTPSLPGGYRSRLGRRGGDGGEGDHSPMWRPRHPREDASGRIPCANCSTPQSHTASWCPRCEYRWPQAKDNNWVECTSCGKHTRVYVKRIMNRREVPRPWGLSPHCHECGHRWPGWLRHVEAKRQPLAIIAYDFLVGSAVLAVIALVGWIGFRHFFR